MKESPNNKYIKQGLVIFLSLSGAILVYLAFSNLSMIWKKISVVTSALQPIFIGLVMAYLVAPLETRMELYFRKKKIKKKIAQGLAVFLTVFFVLVICVVAVRSLLPQVSKTVVDLTITMPGMLNSFTRHVNQWIQSDGQIMALVNEGIDRATEFIDQWMKTGIYDTMTSIVSGIINVFGFVFNIIVGFIVMIYVLFEKDKFRGQAKKILYAVSKNRKVNAFLLDTVRQCDKMFGGFITGKIIDSLIIGILCFICMTILKLPYVALISLIVGVTNVIPFFGPYIGAIPSAFLILLVSPMKCVIFIVFVLVLQQVDGNIIGPRILGESTGLSPFWVLFSILVFGELFGVIGMIIGVPIFATIYYVIKRLIEARLIQQNLPNETEDYVLLDKLDEKNQATFLAEGKSRKRKKGIEPEQKDKDKDNTKGTKE